MIMMGLRGTGKTSILPFLNDILKEQAEPRITFIEKDFGDVQQATLTSFTSVCLTETNE